MIACYFRVSSDRQTVENQFADVLRVAGESNGEGWRGKVDALLPALLTEDPATGRISLDVVAGAGLERLGVFCESHSSKRGARRPVFDRLTKALGSGKYKSLAVWKVSRLGRDMREVIETVYALSDIGVTVNPVHSQTGPITSTMGRLLWAIQAWYAEMENTEKSAAITAGIERARAQGKRVGRPPVEVDPEAFRKLVDGDFSVGECCKLLGISRTTYYRAKAQMEASDGAT
jgi:DNA invertase Pin-like site-specific DNA recombinase